MSTQPRTLQYATPPECTATPPFTPLTEEKTTSSAARIIEEIQNQQKGLNLTRGPWTSYSLDHKGYQELEKKIQRDEDLTGFAEDKLRYDYFPHTSRLVLRMPTYLHTSFATGLVETIQAQLRAVQHGSAEFAEEIRPQGNSTIKFADEEYGRHDPDAHFRHTKAKYPGIVI